MVEVKVAKDSAALPAAPPLHFLIDTGAGSVFLGKEALDAAKLELKTDAISKSGVPITGTGDSMDAKLDRVVDATIKVGELEIPGQFAVVELGSDLRRLGIDGGIGGNFIEHLVVVVDYEKRVIQLCNPETFKAPTQKQHFTAVPILFDGPGGLPYIQTQVTPFGYSPAPARLMLDTGASGAIFFYSPFV